MNDAFAKNQTALANLLGNAALAERLRTIRIGVWSGSAAYTESGHLLAEALGDTLGRLWQSIDATGVFAEQVLGAANRAAAAAGYATSHSQNWSPPYDFVISIAGQLPEGTSQGVIIGGSGWTVSAGARAKISDDPNPVGPTLAAALAGAEAFKVIFADALGDMSGAKLEDLEWSAWSYGADTNEPQLQALNLENCLVLGVGAVTHGLLWILERWPAVVTGSLNLVDPDKYDQSNAQRYAGTDASYVPHHKAAVQAERIHAIHAGLKVVPHVTDMNDYFEKVQDGTGKRLTVAGLDSPEARRQLALKLPGRIVNMWTQGHWLGTARFGLGDGWPCMFCSYPENQVAPLDETGEISLETGLRPIRVRELLFSGAGLTADDVAVIAPRLQPFDATQFIGKPLRSVRGHMCANGKVAIKANDPDTDVPLAFSSLMTGVFGFVELVHEITGAESIPARWVYDVLSAPNPGFLEPTSPAADCYLCADEVTRDIVRQDREPT